MDDRRRRFDPLGVGAFLCSGTVKAKIAEILRRWTERRQPAIMFVLDREAPHAAVYGEDELLSHLKDTPIVHAEPLGNHTPRRLLVFVVDGQETMGYRIADPRF
jgi:hypothetical protein